MKFYKRILSLYSLTILFNFPLLAHESEEHSLPEEKSFRILSETNISSFIEDEELDFTVKGYEHGAKKIAPKIGLSIDGGGIRGLMPAIWLKKLKGQLIDHGLEKQPLSRIFDYTGGTSIGGILALAVAAELEPEIFIKIFEKEAEKVFCRQKRKWFSFPNFYGLTGPQYSSEGLENLLKEENKFGNMTLNEIKTDVLVTACKIDGTPWLFKKDENKDYKLWEVARSTSAAPTYFSAYQPSNKEFPPLVDGGMWVNNPSILVTASIVKEHQNSKFNPKKLHLLSLGTGETPSSILPLNAGKMHAGAFIDALMSSHSCGNHMLMEQFLGKRYHRINPIMAKPIKLDAISKDTISSLKEYAGSEEIKKKIGNFLEEIANIVRKKLEDS